VTIGRAAARKFFAGSFVAVSVLATATAIAGSAAGCASAVHAAAEDRGNEATETSSITSSSPGSSEAYILGAAKAHASNTDLHASLRLGASPQPTYQRSPLEQLMAKGESACPDGMADIGGRFCVDKYEDTLLEVLPNGEERPWSSFSTVSGHTVRAVSLAHAFPQGYVSGNEAAQACARSGKRLCSPKEWKVACEGPKKTTYGYGNERVTGRCNDNGKSAMNAVYGSSGVGGKSYWSMDRMNNPALNQVDGTLSKTGDHDGCTNGFGVYDMVGNLHEWVADPNGTFQGGYYLDTHLNGDGCEYRTMAHEAWYHDYSTGFRCCADEEL
jgi:hypothetical protein